MAIRRVISCNPFARGGYDPVPQKAQPLPQKAQP
jgi:putative component of membrane protein insertase Oxa1/YidC/SpoIIIJ protein YidD